MSAASNHETLLAQLRPVAFGIAYRMLGSVSEAEDVVQESLLRVHQALDSGEQIASPRAYVATIVTRLAINELTSARARRESYVGDWLPEPIITDGTGPEQHAETADSLSMAMLLVLETLSPQQRAAMLLHDVFGYGYREITDILGTSEANARQLATRARAHLRARRPRFQATREQHAELARQFLAAAQEGDLAGLERLLAHDVELVGDGGGRAPSLARSQRGRSRVAHTLSVWLGVLRRLPDLEIRPVELNGDPGALFFVAGRLMAAWSLDLVGGEVAGVRAIVNPDKLDHLGPVGDAYALMRQLSPGRERG